MKRKTNEERLRMWQDRLSRNETQYQSELADMDTRESLYDGCRKVTPVAKKDKPTETPYVRNICSELIESQVNSNIPAPKVTARRKEDEHLAKMIEDMLRNELDRLPFETMNDQQERTVPIQGGACMLVEWDNTKRTHTTIGELSVTQLHPKQVIPQDGVTTRIEDMDYIILKVPQTKGYIRRKYGVDVKDLAEENPDIRGDGEDGVAYDMVTQYIAYYRNDAGGIGLYSWVGDTELEDLDDYQARRLRKCAKCGAIEPAEANPMDEPTLDGTMPGIANGIELPDDMDPKTQKVSAGSRRKVCPYCGSTKWEDAEEDFEEILVPITLSDGRVIPGEVSKEIPSETNFDQNGTPLMETILVPTKIPYYKPDIYPIIMQKNVSKFGKFLGGSDIDRIKDNQNFTNRLSAKISDKLNDAGSYMTRPANCTVKSGPGEMKEVILANAADKQMLDVVNMEGDIGQDMAFRNQVYEEARQNIGITDSFQGRRDPTATSGKAKEFSAAQSAGRLESKRIMKNAFYADLFEAMFKFKLAYTDEPRPVVSKDAHGETVYKDFNRYDFLRQDDAGEWYWNDQFLFSVDTTAPLASNREAMWQETRMNFESGAYGDRSQLRTLILFWTKMQMLHYPGASDTVEYLQEELNRQQQEQQAMMKLQMELQQNQAREEAEAAESSEGSVMPAGNM